MSAFKATLIGVSALAILAAVQTNALARGGHHEAHARPEIPRDASDESGKLHSVLSYGEGGEKAAPAAPAAAESHMRTPDFGESPEGSDLAARGGDIATGNVATGNIATGNAATSHMRTPAYGAAPAGGSDLEARGGDIATGNVATGNVATGNAAAATSKYHEGGDPASKGGAHVVGQVHEDDVAATHPESVPQKSKGSKKECSAINTRGC
jgi:hypothetical protein